MPPPGPSQDSTHSSESAPRIARLLWRAAGVLLALLLLRWGYAVVHILGYPYEWSTMDGYFVSYGQRLLAGEPIYSAHAVPPMGFEYVPGYLVVLGPLTRLFGPGLWVERGLALVLTLGVAAAAGHIVRRRTGSIGWGLMALALCLACPVLNAWYLVRGLDVLVFAVGLTATAALAEPKRLTGTFVVLGALLYVLAFYCKQTAVFPWVAGAAIVFVRARRYLPLFLAVSVGGTLATGFALQAWSGGWFWDNAFVTTAQNPYSFRLLFGLLGAFVPWVALILAGAGALAFDSLRRRAAEPWMLYWGACVAGMALAGKLGAAVVYFLPAYVASVIWGSQATATRWPRLLRSRAGLILGAAAVGQAALAWRVPLLRPDAAAAGRASALLHAIEERPGRVLVERADSFATLAGRSVEWEAVQLPILHKIHGMPIDDLLATLRAQKYAVVLYSGQYFNNLYWLRRTIFTYYKPLAGFEAVPIALFYGDEPYTLLVPRPATELPDAPLLPTGEHPGKTWDGDPSEVQSS